MGSRAWRDPSLYQTPLWAREEGRGPARAGMDLASGGQGSRRPVPPQPRVAQRGPTLPPGGRARPHSLRSVTQPSERAGPGLPSGQRSAFEVVSEAPFPLWAPRHFLSALNQPRACLPLPTPHPCRRPAATWPLLGLRAPLFPQTQQGTGWGGRRSWRKTGHGGSSVSQASKWGAIVPPAPSRDRCKPPTPLPPSQGLRATPFLAQPPVQPYLLQGAPARNAGHPAGLLLREA